MRDLKLIKKCLILLALVWAQIPAGVLAQLCQPTASCEMPCCVAKTNQPKAKAETACAMCPSEDAALSTDSSEPHESSLSANSKADSCPCKIAPRSSPADQSSLAFFTTNPVPEQVFAVCLVTNSLSFDPTLWAAKDPRIVGTDSGPPTHRPNCVWLGRAPPVAVA